ncbi:hypothetical protein SLEP1_g36479 [Rubroshorea leprosula]|uniref:Reverse transcriptase domain-containing protein n=1 Tax=Rubroshorea leprosula TaxID=152421 RepID=A0AAV5KS47_9ROSI|nr:hypothetical protein SLEP1_g36479 [Rubroshorea leprosula]
MRVWLERPFSAEEIEEGLKNCEGNKAPGLDGYNFNFIKFAWNSLKEDFVSFFGEFHQHGKFGFGVRWRGWIQECLSTAKISVLVNGSPTEEFMVGKGLRQGDPLSPFLFLMIAEGLHGLVKKAETKGLIHGIDVGSKGLTISLLQFADDTVILGKANGENIFTVKTILRWFELMSELRINFHKSSIVVFNVAQRWLNGVASVLRCGVGKILFVYLGMPVGGNPGTKKLWDPVLNKFRTKLAVWKFALLSFGGRITLLNSREFLWGGAELKRKIPWVSWEMVCRSKEKGGLRVMDLRRRNWALLGKWWFRLGDGGESLWKRVVWDKYYGGRREVDIKAVDSVRMSRIWRDVISVRGKSIKLQDMLGKGFRWMVGDGRQVGFWREIWVGDKSLKELCPTLFELAMNKDDMVMSWWGLQVVMPNTVGGVMEVFLYELGGMVGRELGACLFLVGSWYIWYWRNIRVFQNIGECRDGLLHMIQSKTFLWIKNKVAGSVFSIVDWKLNPRKCAAVIRKHRSLLRAFHKHKSGKHDE